MPNSPNVETTAVSRISFFQGLRPFQWSELPRNLLAGVTLAAMNMPQSLGYTKIAGTPVITGLYTLLLPLIAFAVFGSSRYLVVAADSATAAILAGSLTGMAPLASARYVALADKLYWWVFSPELASRSALPSWARCSVSRCIGVERQCNFWR